MSLFQSSNVSMCVLLRDSSKKRDGDNQVLLDSVVLLSRKSSSGCSIDKCLVHLGSCLLEGCQVKPSFFVSQNVRRWRTGHEEGTLNLSQNLFIQCYTFFTFSTRLTLWPKRPDNLMKVEIAQVKIGTVFARAVFVSSTSTKNGVGGDIPNVLISNVDSTRFSRVLRHYVFCGSCAVRSVGICLIDPSVRSSFTSGGNLSLERSFRLRNLERSFRIWNLNFGLLLTENKRMRSSVRSSFISGCERSLDRSTRLRNLSFGLLLTRDKVLVESAIIESSGSSELFSYGIAKTCSMLVNRTILVVEFIYGNIQC